MELIEGQFQRIADCLPRQRGDVGVTNLQLLNALLYGLEHGCKWRGNWVAHRSCRPTPTAWNLGNWTGPPTVSEPEVIITSGREVQMRFQNVVVNMPATTKNWPARK